ncbi:dihydroxyacetone kinase subunit DhaL [Polyangium mundeleinium]|uniref:Dihydroxyacetone kinase subunit DhaL n=1 Tax=Polyangium mundeleinium TaxID=2995306 RepID=A0ABT5ER17_9BACT|nr:dihydroxyacetone kinase subunit DhaL [Polyangium mundeleinium]MDC0743812.1 dihydroxyacetone kinase subunit DhaL [Polyangium mundeleinium]
MESGILNGDTVVQWIERAAEVIGENEKTLTELDAAIGDSDHGANMARGFSAVRGKLAEHSRDDVGAILKTVGMTLLSTVGGASGPLYGTLFLEAAKVTAGKPEIDRATILQSLAAGLAGIQKRGKAEPLDKTLVDALGPAIRAFEGAEGVSLAEALSQAAEAARQGAEATIPLVARKGRASYLGERSAGHQDPGATSMWLLLQSLAEAAAE